MGYRVCKSTGVIHAYEDNMRKVCARSLTIEKGNDVDFRTKSEAEAEVRDARKQPRYCKHCSFRELCKQKLNANHISSFEKHKNKGEVV